MTSNFIQLEMQKTGGKLLVKPGEITTISPAPESGSRVVTRQSQIYYVIEPIEDVEAMIRIYFKKLKGEFY